MRPEVVLLDAGGVFLLPVHDRIAGAFARAECPIDPGILDEAHYRAATAFTTDRDVEADWAGTWRRYLRRYVEVCGVEPDCTDEAHRHVDSEFADAALWYRPIAGSRAGLQALADTGVRLGVVSNADGLIATRLAELEIAQVGPGLGVPLECVIDSGNVGVMKPDPRIFEAALDVLGVAPADAWYVGDMPAIDVTGARRAGLRAFLMDPFELHHGADYDRIGSLAELASLIADAG